MTIIGSKCKLFKHQVFIRFGKYAKKGAITEEHKIAQLKKGLDDKNNTTKQEYNTVCSFVSDYYKGLGNNKLSGSYILKKRSNFFLLEATITSFAGNGKFEIKQGTRKKQTQNLRVQLISARTKTIFSFVIHYGKHQISANVIRHMIVSLSWTFKVGNTMYVILNKDKGCKHQLEFNIFIFYLTI